MATAVWLVILAASVVTQVIGAPEAQLRLLPGDNATCPWRVLLTYGDGNGTGHDLCVQQLEVSFGAAEEKVRSPSVPPGYELLSSGNYYKLHQEHRNWHYAREACEREGAHLVVLETAAEADVLRKYLTRDQIDTYVLFAGFHSKFATVLGNTMPYERWQHGEPGANICGLINREMWLSFGSCTGYLPYVCEYEANTSTEVRHKQVPPVTESPVISSGADRSQKRSLLSEEGYTHLPGWNGTLIKNYGGVFTWESANEICNKNGGLLPIVESVDMAEALIDYVNAERIEYFYIGVKTGGPITVLGGEVAHTKYQRWVRNTTETVCLYANNRLFYKTLPCDCDYQGGKLYMKTALCLANA